MLAMPNINTSIFTECLLGGRYCIQQLYNLASLILIQLLSAVTALFCREKKLKFLMPKAAWSEEYQGPESQQSDSKVTLSTLAGCFKIKQ